MAAHDQNSLTGAEQQALALIRELRRQIIAGEIPGELKDPARLTHYLITLMGMRNSGYPGLRPNSELR